MRTSWTTVVSSSVVIALAMLASPTSAQPWDLFQDSLSSSNCDLINAANAELVVLSETGQLAIVTGADTVLADTLVDLDGYVYYMGDQVGLIEFAEDDDGFRTLWWMTLAGHVVNVDEFTGEPFPTDLFPSDMSNVPCDACPFWDDPAICAPPDDDIVDIISPLSFNFCGVNSALTMAMTATGLAFMGAMRRRKR